MATLTMMGTAMSSARPAAPVSRTRTATRAHLGGGIGGRRHCLQAGPKRTTQGQYRTVAPLTASRYASTGPRRVAAEANIFSRLTRVVKSYTNALISKAEDPEKMLDQTVSEMQDDLVKLRQATAQVMASQKQLENKYKAAQTNADDWYRRAQLALGKGDEDLAKEALTRRKAAQDNADTLKAQLDGQSSSVDKLVSNTKILESKLAEAKSKKDTLKARAQSAKTQQKVSEIAGAIDPSSSLAAFEKMEEKVMAMEAEADAVSDMAALTSNGSALEDKFKALEGSSVDDELAKMKAGMLLDGDKKAKGELPPGRPLKEALDPIDAELEALRRKAKEG